MKALCSRKMWFVFLLAVAGSLCAFPPVDSMPGGLFPGFIPPGTVIPGPGNVFPGSGNEGGFYPGNGGLNIPGTGDEIAPPKVSTEELRVGYYQDKCPNAEAIVRNAMQQAVEKEPRIAASMLRLHFHDCFVGGCDGSNLLDDRPGMRGEKSANPNINSARGFNVIDEIKFALERECEGVVSCADLLAIAARDGVVLSEGPSWDVPLGRKDSLKAFRNAANTDIPPPNSTLSQLIAAFEKKGLSASDMVALSGSHTIGISRCVSFTQRLYNFQGTGRPDPSLEPEYLRYLQEICPQRGEGNVTAVLDFATPNKFDNHYYINLQFHKGLLISDQVLFAPNAGDSNNLVMSYSYDEAKFFADFSASMIRMGNINPFTGERGEIRRNCRFVNRKQY